MNNLLVTLFLNGQKSFVCKKVKFLCIYQPLLRIIYQSDLCRIPILLLFNPKVKEYGVHNISSSISQKADIMASLKFELTFYDS